MDHIWSELEFEATDLVISPENILLNKKHLKKQIFQNDGSLRCPLISKNAWSSTLFSLLFRKQHRTTTAAAIKVVNRILHALGEKQFCLSLFRDSSKAFDAVDYSVLPDCLKATGFSDHTSGRFINYLLGRTQSSSDSSLWDIHTYMSHQKGSSSRFSPGTTIIYNLYSLPQNIQKAFFNFNLQHAFNSLQDQFCLLQRVLNADKSTHVLFFIFMNKKSIVCENCYKKAGKKLTWDFLSNISGVILRWYQLVFSTFVSVLDCGDAPYMNAFVQSLHMLDGGLWWIMVSWCSDIL